ncbi:hypothetical protein [Demequina litorisediminis]|uniref:hypothetical protein n=1 Tax=Demequina litorisediminis TaxID=1849022 RepID=UPI0024E097F6|nr:hypothetical protein [Demequina litorisediminis]
MRSLPRLVERVALPGEDVDVSEVQIPVESKDEVGQARRGVQRRQRGNPVHRRRAGRAAWLHLRDVRQRRTSRPGSPQPPPVVH